MPSPRRPVSKSNSPQPRTAKGAALFVAASLAALGIAAYRSITMRWLSDDIYVTFRYIQQWFDGAGIVYNVGERVEGYTHFLWMLLLAGVRLIGVDVEVASQWLGILSFLGTTLILALIARQLHGGMRWTLPFAALALAFNYDSNVWATSGLETAFVTLLLTSAFFLYFFTSIAERTRLIGTGALLMLAAMTRPDMGLMYAIADASLVIAAATNKTGWRSALRTLLLFNAAFLIVYLPYLAWKLKYYGDILPVTFYARVDSLIVLPWIF